MAKNKGYFAWLVEFVAKPSESKKYYSLLNLLYSSEFFKVVEKDENRISDAYRLRNDYEDLIGRKINIDLSILEVLVSFSIRANNAMSVECDDWDEVHDLFWAMINNMGLIDQTEQLFDDKYCMKILSNMVNRTYNSDGSNGGLFIIDNPPEDLRDVEIWWQYQWWDVRQ